MKLTKKLIPAIGMLMLSAVMLVTSSFAWFSMNDKVTVSNMKVTAKGDQIYLQIVDDTADFEDGKSLTSLDYATEATSELFPVNVASSYDNATKTKVDYKGGKDFKWVTAIGTAPDNGAPTQSGDPAKPQYSLVTGTGYYLKKTVYVRLDETYGVNTASGKLRVESVTMGTTTDDFAECVSVIAVADNYSQLYKQTALGTFALASDDSGEKSDAALSADKYTNPTAGWTTVDIYIFFDGDNPVCTLDKLVAATNNAAGYGITITFTVA